MRALSSKNLGTLEVAILEIFWTQDAPRTVSDIHEALRERNLAHTTILNTIMRMANKGWLGRTTQCPGAEGGRGVAYVYTAQVTKGALIAATIEESCQRLGASERDRTEALAPGAGVKW